MPPKPVLQLFKNGLPLIEFLTRHHYTNYSFIIAWPLTVVFVTPASSLPRTAVNTNVKSPSSLSLPISLRIFTLN